MTAPPRSLKELFLAALEVAPAGRVAWLERECADAALREHLGLLLAAHDAPQSLLDRPAAVAPTNGWLQADAGRATGQPVAESPGTAVGPYKLVERIGEGGMGTVWLARQSEPVKRLVALKLIKPGMDSRQVLARFEAERQALALMEHPNIARVLDGGTASAGRPFFVMDLVKGVPITQHCDEHRLTVRQRLELFIPVCRAVQHAHQKGVIHRDLKPSNVLVAMGDGTPVPKVIDFGVAKAVGQPLTEQTLVTGLGAIVGTLEYMSPEQAEFNQLDIDTRSDVYSLGVLLYELLTGTTPFTRQELEKGGLLEMLRVIREQEPTKPSTKLSTAEGLPALAANRGTGPSGLPGLLRGEPDWIVMKALEKDRNRRYESANALAHDVQLYLADEPVAAGPPSLWYHFCKFAQRNKGAAAVAAGVFLAVLVMVASIGWVLGDRAAKQAEAELRGREDLKAAFALIAENKLAAARQKLAAARARLGNDRPAGASLAAEVEAAEAELERLQQFLDLIDLAHQAETAPGLEPMLVAGGSPGRGAKAPPPATKWGSRTAAAVPLRLQALACYGVLECDHWDTTLEGGLLGRDQVEQIRRTVYDELLWLAADLADRQREHRSGKTLSHEAAARAAIVYLGKAERVLGPTQALYVLRARCRKALGEEAAAQADRRLAERVPPALAVDHYLRGIAAYQASQLAEGVEAFEAALRLEPTHYWSLLWLGCCLCDLGGGPEEFAGAVRVFTGCVLNRPAHAHAYRCRGLACRKLGQHDKALADFSRAIDLDSKVANAWLNRGDTYWEHLGQPAKAVADYTRAIELDPNLAIAWLNRGVVSCDHLGQYDKAAADFSRAIELDPGLAEAWHNRGVAFHNLRRCDRAVADFSRAIELVPKLAEARYNRGVAYDNLGQHEKAVADYSKAIDLDPKYTGAWNSRGIVYCDRLGQPARAVADFSRAIELDPKHTDAWYNRGVAYNGLGQHEEAVADYSKAIDLDPKRVSAWYNRGVIYCDRLGQPARAVADFSRAIELGPNYADAWISRGLAYGKLHRHDKAAADHSRAIELCPKDANAWLHRGVAYQNLGRHEKAVADYSKAINLHPRLARAWHNRGLAYRMLGRHDKAVADYSEALELNPKYTNAWHGRGNAHQDLGQHDKAIADYETVLELAPANAWAHNSLGWLLATCPETKLRNPGRGVELAKEAVRLAPKSGNCWRTLGVAHYRAADWKAAVTALNKSVELRAGGDAFDRLFLAMAYRKLDRNDESREAYRQAMRWLEENEATLARNKAQADELRRFRAEAEAVLELKKK